MYALILILIVLVFLCGPQLWAKQTLSRHDGDREDFPGTGIGFARHLVSQMKMSEVAVEETEAGDHYDPIEKVVRLNPKTCGNRSLTAMVVAAHEVGHAIQDSTAYQPLHIRTRLVLIAQTAEKVGAGLLIAMPLVALVTRTPAAGLLFFLGGLGSMGVPALVHLLTLPVECDASFRRALPILSAYLSTKDRRAARRILTACALTYLASSLAGLVNFWRWISILRR